MTQYLEFYFKIEPVKPWNEILIANLIEQGFDSFIESSDGILAYINARFLNEKKLKRQWLLNHDEVKISYTYKQMPNINWNAEWEKNFKPINIEDKVLIRAEFHKTQRLEEEIIIQPKMSFGTGHHATTYLMIQQMINIDFSGRKVLDVGCGTSILGIYAKKKGALDVLGIDIDKWAIENSRENAERNNTAMRLKLLTVDSLIHEKFDIIMANINRETLISDIPKYVKILERKGFLLLSGLLFFDMDDIMYVCKEQKLQLQRNLEREEWCSLLLTK